jgi:hypothetical protein
LELCPRYTGQKLHTPHAALGRAQGCGDFARLCGAKAPYPSRSALALRGIEPKHPVLRSHPADRDPGQCGKRIR